MKLPSVAYIIEGQLCHFSINIRCAQYGGNVIFGQSSFWDGVTPELNHSVQAVQFLDMAKISKVRLLQIIIFIAFGIDSSKNSSYCLSPLFVLTTLIPALHIVKWHLGKLHPLTFQFLVDLDQQGAPPGNSSSASDVTAGAASKSPGPTPLVLAVLSAVVIVAAVVNLSIRVAIVFLHKKIRHLCHEFKKLNSTRTFSQWSHNELGLAIIIVLSCMLRYSNLIGDFVEKINHSSDRTAWNLTASCFYMHIREIYGGEFQIEAINLVFVCLIVSIVKNMREHSPESQLRSLGISDSLLPRQLLRRERLRLLTNKYLTWMKFWRNANDALGFIFVCLFVQLFLTLSFTTFIFITASIDMSFYHPVAVGRFVQSSLIFGKILCLGNAAHELKMTVGLARVNNVRFNSTVFPPWGYNN